MNVARWLLVGTVASLALVGACADPTVSSLCSGPACAKPDGVTFGDSLGADLFGEDAFVDSAQDSGSLDLPPEVATDLPNDVGTDTTPLDVVADVVTDIGPDGPPADVAPDAEVSLDTDVSKDTGTPGECTTIDDCVTLFGAPAVGSCDAWACEQGTCATVAATGDTMCSTFTFEFGTEYGYCAPGGICAQWCGDGFLQDSMGEVCDDKNTTSGDGCRDDCQIEEPIGAGFTGGQCQVDEDCAPLGAVCIPGAGGGSCAVACTSTCSDQAGSPVTFCIDTAAYDKSVQDDVSIPAELYPALCVSKCDFGRFPRHGCRDGFHCELHTRHNQSVEDEVCVPGPWHTGLKLDVGGDYVIGLDPDGPTVGEPWSRLLDLTCNDGGFFQPIPSNLFRALGDTLSAMGPDGRNRDWERLCEVPSDLPDVYDLHLNLFNSQTTFRLMGSRTQVVDWTAAGAYGGKEHGDVLVGGPLYPVRHMVYANDGTYYLLADNGFDYPHADPKRGRTFGWVNGEEWGPLDAALEPAADYVCIKANSGGRFYRGWGRADVVAYIAGMAMDHLAAHGELLGVGDLSLPTGGDIDDHGSHELGRDVDLYLVTSDPVFDGQALGSKPWLWVSACAQSGGWVCNYWENATGADEVLAGADHTDVATMLSTLAQYAYENPPITHFVQNDVNVLQPFIDLPGSTPAFVHAGNNAASGWPPHNNHIHVRFPL